MSHSSHFASKLFFLFTFLFLGLFGFTEKGWGADEKCGEGKKGTCKIAEGTLKGNCPSGWSTYSYDQSAECNPVGSSKTICCIADGDVCAGKKEGNTCKTNDKNGNCVGGKCLTESANPGELCGNGGKCILTGTKEYEGCVGAYFIGMGGRSCKGSSYVCCKIDSKNGNVCGSNGGTCKSSCDENKGYKEDTAGTSSCAGMKCCYYAAKVGYTSVPFGYDNPLGEITSFTDWANQLLLSLQNIIGWLAVIMIMIGGIVYLTSAGTNQTTLGKNIITAALIGFAVVVAAPTLLKEIKDLLSSSSSTSSSAIDNAKDIKSILTSTLNFLLMAMGTLALIGFAVGGIFQLTAFGNKSKFETGKKMAFNSLYAIALSGGGLILVNQILSLLGG